MAYVPSWLRYASPQYRSAWLKAMRPALRTSVRASEQLPRGSFPVLTPTSRLAVGFWGARSGRPFMGSQPGFGRGRNIGAFARSQYTFARPGKAVPGYFWEQDPTTGLWGLFKEPAGRRYAGIKLVRNPSVTRAMERAGYNPWTVKRLFVKAEPRVTSRAPRRVAAVPRPRRVRPPAPPRPTFSVPASLFAPIRAPRIAPPRPRVSAGVARDIARASRRRLVRLARLGPYTFWR